MQAAEVLLDKLESLVNDDQVIGGKDAQGLGQRLMEEERAMARVHLDVRMALPHPSPLHSRRQGYQHTGTQANGPPNAAIEHGRLARPRGPGSGHHAAVLLRKAREALVLHVVLDHSSST